MDRRPNEAARGQTTPGGRPNDRTPVPPPRPTKRPTADAPKPKFDSSNTDFMVTCDDGFYRVHKPVLSAASPYFQAMFRFAGKEMKNNGVNLEGHKSAALKAVLNFMYFGSYTLPGGTIIPSGTYCTHRGSTNGGSSAFARILKLPCLGTGKALSPLHLQLHVRIYILADYLRMDALKDFVRARVVEVLHVFWKDMALGLAEALEDAFSNTVDGDVGLRQPLIEILKEHYSLWSEPDSVRAWLEAHPRVFEKVWDGFE